MRRNYISADPEENETPIDKSFICENTICAIAAADSSADTVWFIYITKSDCIEEDSVTDAYGHVIAESQPFIKCHYLEKHKDLKKGVVYIKRNKDAFVYKETIVHPWVDMETNYNNCVDLFFLKNENYVEILNFVQLTYMGSLF